MKLANRTLLQKWRYRLKTTVRYRLLILTSAPILFTLVALIAISIYWSLHYTWQSALVDVSERLGVARNSVSLLQQRQANEVRAFAESYAFRRRVLQMSNGAANNPLSLRQWVSAQKARYSLDFLNFAPIDPSQHDLSQQQARYQALSARDSFFDVLSHEELTKLSPALAERAKIQNDHSHSEIVETRGLVSRTIVAVNDEHHNLIGFLDGGLLLNNSSALVDQLRDLIYPMRREQMRSVGTVTIFLDALRISTNVPLDSSEQQGRAVGTRVSDAVQTQVLQQGQQWVDRAYVYDAWYITAYEPIRDSNQQVIGMLYTGHLLWPFVKSYLTNIVEIAIATLSLLLVSGIFVYRGSRDLFRPIERIHRVVKLVQLGKNQRIGELGLDHDHELAQLARQFDNMLDLLQQRNEEIQRAAHELEGKVSERTASLQDKTAELEHHIQLLNQTRDKLIVHEKLAALGELTAGIAHEINNPTAVILGNTELIRFELGDDAKRVEEEIDAILLQIDRIRNITRSLLQYSRHGGVQDEITWQHINPIIEESITLVKTGTKKRDIEFVTRFEAQSSVEVNRHQLLQILVNLQMNAIHAMNGQGKLTISSEDWCEQGEVLGAVVHIDDQGCGIKPEYLKRVFDPFYTTKREGTGLGLSVSQSLLSQTGGEIRVRSEYGKGSTFSVYLPSKADAHLLITKAS
ncbi:cache domain-containing protein [Vibrio sp. ABG19]|uniref:sensor histidine kinase n=1 Tax=Vibrio sp. ABG19 TaxID=2817385 RepID=UPI00249F6F7C|nr:cache domain-containing protein [Vibrio sp. ABG19]WGY48745.1 cache domain-containing protein [Vibrio sp. ABG19]